MTIPVKDIRVRAFDKDKIFCDKFVPVNNTGLEGMHLTHIHICSNLESKQDCDDLINFLIVHKHCFSKISNRF